MTKGVIGVSSLLLAYIFLLAGCATISTPTGGDKDITAPKVMKRSVGDSSLLSQGGKWTVDFDEFIKVQDLNKEMTITPLLKSNPTVTVHKRRLTLSIPDSLLAPNTTYCVQLGNAVRDLREGNPYNGLSWTFSTGAYFDSLRIYGHCIDAQTGIQDTTMFVFLYPAETPDSLLWIEKPLYVTQNTANGFAWNNLPPRDFKLVALEDDNLNYRRDAPTQRIAFTTRIINPLRDTTPIQLLSFSESANKSSNSKEGIGKRFEQKKQPVFSYTVNVDTGNINQRSFNIYDTLQITFNRKPTRINLTGIRLYEDSVLEAEAQLLPTHDSLVYHVPFNWQENTVYRFSVMNSLASDSNGQNLVGRDFRFRTKQMSDYGIIRVRYTAHANHRLQLVSNNKLVATQLGNDSVIVFNRLLPGQYTLLRHIDENNNGIWDTGSWAERRQPERVEQLKENIIIKGNWENAIDIRTTNR